MNQIKLRHNWTLDEVMELFEIPFGDLISKARKIHEENWNPNEIQVSVLMSIKTGSCSEDCSYCSQAGKHKEVSIKKESLTSPEKVVECAKEAKDAGASRFCMGAAWRGPTDRHIDEVCKMIKEVKDLGLETCVTLGLLKDGQAEKLKAAGLDYYNHNIDTSEEFYSKIITTRTFQDRLDTLEKVREANINVCTGGIIGMGETRKDRAGMLIALANMPKHPDSLPINKLIPIPGTPLEHTPEIDVFEFVKTLAIARIIMPKSYVRLSAGRASMSKELQALCFFAGANSIFKGDKLLTSDNAKPYDDDTLFKDLGLSQK